MNRYLILRVSILAILTFTQFHIAFSQEKGKWQKDSVYNALAHIFPAGSHIQLIDSGKVEQKDSMLNGWWMKAIITPPGDTCPTYFHFYHETDKSILRHAMDVWLTSEMNAVAARIANPYLTSLPFLDSSSNTIFLYTARIDLRKAKDPYDSVFAAKICRSFRVPTFGQSMRMPDTNGHEVKKEPLQQPPPPPPKKKQQ